MIQTEAAARLRELHASRPLVLPNAWDAASARVIEQAGAPAIATTSAGVAWSLGYADGQQLSRDEMLDVIARIVRAVQVPVTADVESGYGTGSLEDVAETVRALVALGVAGINLEDSPGRDGSPLLTPSEQAARIAAAREAASAAGGDLVINARTDVYLAAVGEPASRFDAVVQRARAYAAAGADCIFVPGVLDADTIGALVHAIDAPLNVMALPGAPDVAELAALGVARVSVGPAITATALATVRDAARELLGSGSYRTLEPMLPFGGVDSLFASAVAAH